MTQWGLDTLFNPAKRHMDEEKLRLQSTRAEVGDNSGGKRIDLESGRVVIRKAEDDEDVEPGSSDAATPEKSGTESKNAPASEPKRRSRQAGGKGSSIKGGAASKPKKAPDQPVPTAAAIRAAQRRGRTPR